MDIISFISNNVAFVLTTVVFLFTAYHHTVFRWLSVIPFTFSIAALTYELYGAACIFSNVMYDTAAILTCLFMVMGRMRFISTDAKIAEKCSICTLGKFGCTTDKVN